jgi:hypothetical protein
MLPPQAWGDEIWFALRARELLHSGQLRIFYATYWGGVHPLLVWLTALVQALGFERLIVASRLVSTTAGVVSVPLAFACFDELWRGREDWPGARRRLAAALAALVLSNWLYVIAVTRVGTEPALALALALFCVWQQRRAARTRRWRHWLAAGAGAGIAQYLSPHARFILPVLAWLALHDLWLSGRAAPRRAAQFRALRRGIGAMGLAATLAALPLIVFFVREPEWFLARARAVTAIPQQSGPAFLLDNLRLILLGFSLYGDLNARHNLPGRPMLDWVQSIGFWIGLAWALARARRSAPARDLMVWAAIMAAPSLVTDEAPQFERMIGLAAPASALIACGWLTLWEWLSRRLTPRAPRLALNALAPLAVFVSLGLNADAYFVRYPAHPSLPVHMTVTPVNLGYELAARARAGEAVFAERPVNAYDVFAFDFLFADAPVRRMEFRDCLPLAHARPARTTYLVMTGWDQQSVGALTRMMPSAAVTYVQAERATLIGQIALVEAPPGAALAPPSLSADARFAPGLRLLGYEWSGPQVKAGDQLALTLYWRAEADLSADATAFLHVGTGLGDSQNIAQHDGPPCNGFYATSQWRTGDVIPDRFTVKIPPDAPPGDYPLAVGWYDWPSLERLPLLSAGEPLPDSRAVIGRVTIIAP